MWTLMITLYGALLKQKILTLMITLQTKSDLLVLQEKFFDSLTSQGNVVAANAQVEAIKFSMSSLMGSVESGEITQTVQAMTLPDGTTTLFETTKEMCKLTKFDMGVLCMESEIKYIWLLSSQILLNISNAFFYFCAIVQFQRQDTDSDYVVKGYKICCCLFYLAKQQCLPIQYQNFLCYTDLTQSG